MTDGNKWSVSRTKFAEVYSYLMCSEDGGFIHGRTIDGLEIMEWISLTGEDPTDEDIAFAERLAAEIMDMRTR